MKQGHSLDKQKEEQAEDEKMKEKKRAKERKNGGIIKMKSNMNLQDIFLNQVRKENISITVFLMNGFQLRGNVKGFDNYTLVLDSDGKQQMIYKHAISTIIPAKPVNFYQAQQEEME